MKTQFTREEIVEVADNLHCSMNLALDLLTLAGGDTDIIYQSSEQAKYGIESFKANIINKRFNKIGSK